MHDFIHSRTSICCFDWFDFSGQMDGQECLSTSPSYICFLVSNSIHAYITKIEQVIFGPSGWGAIRVTDLKKAVFQNLLCCFWWGQQTHIRSNRNKQTDLGFQPRCNRVVNFGVTKVYNCSAVINLGATEFANSAEPLFISSNVSLPHPHCCRCLGLRIVSAVACASSPQVSITVNGSLPRHCCRSGSSPS
jgi:hypothetical protein